LTPELRENAAVVGESAGLRGRAVIHSVAAFESRPAAPSGAINSVVFDCLIMVHVAVGLSTACWCATVTVPLRQRQWSLIAMRCR
jgi:hypothetical protein